MTGAVLGIDPGAHGAAVLNAERWWCWRTQKSGEVVVLTRHEGTTVQRPAHTQAHLAALLLADMQAYGHGSAFPVVLEAPYESLALAESRGMLLGGLRLAGWVGELHAPRYSEWIPLLGLQTRSGKERLDAAVLQWGMRHGLPRGLSYESQLAWSEAAAMALWEKA